MGYQHEGVNAVRITGGVGKLGRLVVAIAACAAFAGVAAAQGATSPAVTSATGDPYRACTDGTASEDRATCMKEAGAAKAEAQRGQLTNNGGNYDRNALQRCDALPGDQREACRLRIMGAGTASGSVAGGGIVREVVIQDPTPAQPTPTPTPMPMPMPMPSTTTGSGSVGGNGAGISTDATGATPR